METFKCRPPSSDDRQSHAVPEYSADLSPSGSPVSCSVFVPPDPDPCWNFKKRHQIQTVPASFRVPYYADKKSCQQPKALPSQGFSHIHNTHTFD